MLRPASLEEGGRFGEPPGPERRKLRLGALRALGRAAAGLLLAFYLQVPILRQVEVRVGRQAVVCLTPRHVWGFSARAVSFSDSTLVAPRLLGGSGRVVSWETSTLCPGAPARQAIRFESVQVEHRTPPWPWLRTARLTGERAACLQHMLDLERGVSPCKP